MLNPITTCQILGLLELLSDFGYVPLSEKPEKKLAEFIRTSLEKRLSKTLVDAILEDSTHNTKASYEEILLNPDLFSRTFEDLFGKKATKSIIRMLQDDLFEQGLSTSTENLMDTILNEIRKNEIMEFIQKIKGHEHVAYLWKNDDSRRLVFSEFFKHGKSTKGFISKENLNVDFPIITYDELFSNKSDSIEREKNLILSTHEKNTTNLHTCVAGDNCDRWLKEGLWDEFIELENYLDKYSEKESLSCLCGYDVSGLPSREHIEHVLSSHEYVIIDDPLMIYKRSVK